MSSSEPEEWLIARERSTQELLQIYADVLVQLRAKGIARTGNNPVGDFAEALFVNSFKWKIASNSERGHDAVDARGARYQIKGRRITHANSSRELGILRKLDEHPFDFLAAVLVDERFAIVRAIIMPISEVLAHSTFSDYGNGWKFQLRDARWDHPDAIDATAQLRSTAEML